MEQDEEGAGERGTVLAAFRRFRSADAERQTRVRAATGMGDNEMRLIQYIVSANRDGRDVMPSEIARYLGISSASTTALLDRLERSGALERQGHPTDRRSILIAPTPTASATLAATVEAFEGRVDELGAHLDEKTRAAVIAFLDALTASADAIAPAAANS